MRPDRLTFSQLVDVAALCAAIFDWTIAQIQGSGGYGTAPLRRPNHAGFSGTLAQR